MLQQLHLLLFALGALHSCSKSSRTLLVHFGPGGDTVDSEVEQPTGSHDIHDLVDVDEDVLALFLEVLRDADVLVFGVDAGMDEAIHVDVEVVDLGVARHGGLYWRLTGVFEHFRVAHAHPLEKDRNSHCR